MQIDKKRKRWEKESFAIPSCLLRFALSKFNHNCFNDLSMNHVLFYYSWQLSAPDSAQL